MSASPRSLQTLTRRYDAGVFEPTGGSSRVRLAIRGDGAWDAVLEDGTATLVPSDGDADATLSADEPTWAAIAKDVRGGMEAYRDGRLGVRRNLHVGIGFLAATSGRTGPGRLRFRMVATRRARLSTLEAGTGPAVVALHGLGATKGSFIPTVAALADRFRVIALDLPGFGDSDKPIGASYDARFFARAVVDLLDALEIERAHLIGNSLGGRMALEVGLEHPERVDRLVLLAPSLAWRRERAWAPLVRLTRPELGLVQLAPRPVVDAVVRRMIPNADDGWTAAGVDEFLRAYLTRAGRAAFYAAARQIYLEEPHGADGFWTRLRGLEPDSLFVWGRRDRLVPIAFERHVADALPQAQHLELDCGHVPQIERPAGRTPLSASFWPPPPPGSRPPRAAQRRATRTTRSGAEWARREPSCAHPPDAENGANYVGGSAPAADAMRASRT